MDSSIRTITTDKAIEKVAVSNDIALVATQMNNLLQAAYTYDLMTGQLLQTMKAQGNLPNSVSLSPNGKLAVAATEGPRAVLWDAHSGALVKTAASPGSGSDNNSQVAFSPDGQVIASIYFADIVIFDTTLAQKTISRSSIPAVRVAPSRFLRKAASSHWASAGWTTDPT